MQLKDVEGIYCFSSILNHKSQIEKLVEPPLVDICKYLYDLNIPTTMSSANLFCGHKTAFITIAYDLLSKENKKLIDTLSTNYPNHFQFGKFSTLEELNEISIQMPINKETTTNEVQDFFWEIAKQFSMQDVQSFMDADTFLKNVYNIPDLFFKYLYSNRNQFADNSDFDESQEIEDFLASMNYIKKKASTFNNGNNIYNGICKNIWIDNKIDNNWFADFEIYDAIRTYKNVLFGDNPIKKENININELLRNINRISNYHYGENFLFNLEDQRFYLNEELLNKHNKYIQHIQEQALNDPQM